MASFDDVRKYQRRTQNKEYRLRKQGADQAKINAVSPLKPWAEIKTMNARQRSSYIKKLDIFNKKIRLVGSTSGDVIPKQFITQVKKLMQRHNRFVAKETKRIKGLAPDLWDEYRARQKGILAHEESIGGLLTPIDTSKLEPPRSLAAAKRRVASYEKRTKRNFDFYRKIQKRNMMKMLDTLGLYDLSELVRNMTKNQFDIASSILPVWENLSPEYVSVGESVGDPYQNIRSYLYKAYSMGRGSDELKDVARLEKNRPGRERAGIRRANKELEKSRNEKLVVVYKAMGYLK